MMSMRPDLPPIHEVWVYLSGSPLFALTLTLASYSAGVFLYERTGKHPLANPVLFALAVITGVLIVGDIPYKVYFEGAQFVHFMLGTATVALAIPIYQGWHSLRGRLRVLLFAVLAGGVTSVATSAGVLYLLGVDTTLIGAMYAKSVTAPIAMGVAERISISPTLTAVFAVTTGILGAVLGRYVLNSVGVMAWWQRGFALGVAAHGIGTSRALSVHPVAGAYASLGMGLHGVMGALVIPLLHQYFSR
jgi:predicted murein hydrolase (TIGR00659 family)